MSFINDVIPFCGQSLFLGREPKATLLAKRLGYLFNLRVFSGGANYEVINEAQDNNQYDDDRDEWGAEFEFPDLATSLGRDIYLLKYTEGGSILATDWKNSTGLFYQRWEANITNTNLFMTNRGKTFRYPCVFWGQGEGDTLTQAHTDAYEDNLRDLRSGINTHIGSVPHWFIMQLRDWPAGNSARVATIAAAQATIVAENPTTCTLFTNVGSTFDDLHWDAAGNITMGQKMIALAKPKMA